MNDDCVSRQEAYDALMAEPLKWDDSSVWESARCHQWTMDMDVIKALPPAQPQYTELSPEEAASEIASGSIMSASYWLDAMMRLKQMGYAICREKG